MVAKAIPPIVCIRQERSHMEILQGLSSRVVSVVTTSLWPGVAGALFVRFVYRSSSALRSQNVTEIRRQMS